MLLRCAVNTGSWREDTQPLNGNNVDHVLERPCLCPDGSIVGRIGWLTLRYSMAAMSICCCLLLASKL